MRVVWEYAHGVGAQWVCYTFATFFAIITGGRARGAVRKASVSIKQARAMSVRSAMCGSWDGGREGCFPRSGRSGPCVFKFSHLAKTASRAPRLRKEASAADL